ncbi:MAG TPA: hypothetical protein EYG89_01470 [Bacteroidia bacterium]|nr:hypothetical protein [Bacteroidia bacterium]
MEFNQILFLQLSAMLLFATSISDYINLNIFSKSSIFNEGVKNKDIISTRIMMEIKDENSIFYLNGNMWSMIFIGIIGSMFYFKSSHLFNILPLFLLSYFLMQYFLLVLKVKEKTNLENPTFNEIEKNIDEIRWDHKTIKINLNKLSKSCKEELNISSRKDGKINFNGYIDLKNEKILSKIKDSGDILFYDDYENRYELFYNNEKPIVTKTKIFISPVFTELNREFNTIIKMRNSLFESAISVFVLYLTLIGISLY